MKAISCIARINEINKDYLLGKSKELRKEIDILRNDIKKKNIFDKLMKNLEIYYNISQDIINSYDIKKRYYSKEDKKRREKYEGKWKDGSPNGEGVIIYKNG